MTDLRDFGAVRYLYLCDKGAQLQTNIDRDMAETRRISRLLLEAEDGNFPANIARLRRELDEIRRHVHEARGVLMQHVAHCTDGCVRDKSSGLSDSAYTNQGAPMHSKPELPRMEVIAARLRDGEALEVIAAEYDRHPHTLRPKLSAAGFSAVDGRPTTRLKVVRPSPKRSLVPDEPWRDYALCAQTDPESFFPEKGGSTRDAKSVCNGCTVSAECLDYALANDERHGIWGGLSERDRRKVAQALRDSNNNLDQESA